MKRMKQAISWLLVMVMMISLMPANLVRAEGEEGASGYDIIVSQAICLTGASPYNNYAYTPDWEEAPEPAWDISLSNQENVTETEYHEYQWTGTDAFTVYVTIPEECDGDYIYLMDIGADKRFDLVATGETNQYSATITPSSNMYLQVYDDTYCSISEDLVLTNFYTYMTNDSGETVSCYKRGGTYKYNIKSDSKDVIGNNLTCTVDSTQVELTKKADNWYSYTFSNLSDSHSIVLYESGTQLQVNMPNVSAYGYEISDTNGKKIDYNNGVSSYSVDKGGSLTFTVTALEDEQYKELQYEEYGIYIGEEELVATSGENGVRTYTISNVTWTTYVSLEPKYSVSLDSTEVKMIPCTAEGVALADTAVSKYYWRQGYDAYFKLNTEDLRYSIKNEDGLLTPDDNGVYSVLIGDAPITLQVEKGFMVSHGEFNGASIYMADDASYIDAGYVKGEGYKYYTSTTFDFYVKVWEDYNGENMKVKVKGTEGEPVTLTCKGSDDDDGYVKYYYETAQLTEDVEILVEGVYATETSRLEVIYDRDVMSEMGVSIKVLDADGKEVAIDSTYANLVGYSIYMGLAYTLQISGEEAVLKTLKVKADKENLTGEIQDGIWTADITNVKNIQVACGDQYYVSVALDANDPVEYIYVAEYDLDNPRQVDGYYPKGDLKFWIGSNYSAVSAANAYVVSIKDAAGNTVAYTQEKNVEVDDYGTKATVYTVNVATDITITIAGGEYYRYDVSLPIPTTEDYTISALYYMRDAETPVEYTGVKNAATGYTTFKDLSADAYVYFDVIADASKGTPYVKISSEAGGDTSEHTPLPEDSKTLDGGKVKYTYAFNVSGQTNIKVSVATANITVNAVGNEGETYYSQYSEGDQSWYIYGEDPDGESEEGTPILEIYGLPKVIDTSDTEQQYYIRYSICEEESLMVDDQNYDKFFTLQGTDKEDKALTYIDDRKQDYNGYYEAPLSDGYTTLVVDMTLLEEKNGKVSLESYCDDVKIAIVGKEGEDYITLENQTFDYKVQNKTLTFTVTATGDTFPEDVFINFGYYYDEVPEPEISDGGLTKTYTLTNVTFNNAISVSYAATVAFEQCAYGWICADSYGQGAQWDENDTIIDYGTYGSGNGCYMVLGVAEGYDVDSVQVVQKYFDEEGNEQTTTYKSLLDGYGEFARGCRVVLQKGRNTFSITEPKKLTYTMDMPVSAAYSIEYVNGSTTTVEYGDAFSFKLNAKTGYDLSEVVVCANDEKMTPDANGVYTVKNVNQNYTITVTGFATSKYVVTFKDYDGTILKAQTVEYGKAAIAPASPMREGYTFAGWDTTYTNVTKDITVTATYKPILVSKLTITGDYKNLAVNKTMQLKAVVAPTNALDTGVVWISSNPKYATVSATGKVKALKKGAGKTVTITATAKDGSGVKATYRIKIYKNAVKKIKLSAKSKTVKAGKKVTVKAKLTPSKGICKTLKWTSSNTKWATVSSKGVVTTKKAGKGKTVTITAKAMDGSNKKASIKIKIKK